MFDLGLGKLVPVFVYAAALPVGIASILSKPQVGLLFLVPLLPLQNVMEKIHQYPMGKDLVDILLACIIIGLVRARMRKGVRIVQKTPLNVPIATYALFSFVSLLWGSAKLGVGLPLSGEDFIRFMDWKNLMILPVLFCVTTTLFREKRWVDRMVLGIIASLLVFDFFFYREFRWVETYHYTHDMRVGGAFSYLGPNETAAFLAQYMVFAAGLLPFMKRRLGFVALLCVLGFTGYCVMYSFSRTGYLALCVGIGFLLALRWRVGLIGFLLLLAFGKGLLPSSVIERIEMTVSSEEQRIESGATFDSENGKEGKYDGSTESRFALFDEAIELFKTSPLLGNGFRTFSQVYGMDAHNNFAKMLAEGGAVGFLIYIYLYYVAFRAGMRLYRVADGGVYKGLGLGFMSCVLTNAVNNLSHDNWMYINLMGFYWVLLGIVVSCADMCVEERKQLRESGADQKRYSGNYS